MEQVPCQFCLKSFMLVVLDVQKGGLKGNYQFFKLLE